MKIDLNEIWEFMEMAPAPKTADKGDQWVYELVAGDIVIPNLKSENITNLKKEENYDTELLPSIFTFREILWQPNVYTDSALCVPQLNILKVFCEEHIQELKESQNGEVWPYFNLLEGLGNFCSDTLNKIEVGEKKKKGEKISFSSILGELRKNTFPIVKFFIFHPMNRKDYQRDALNRLNYAVKIMLTQYNNKYFDLTDPYWNVTVGNPAELNKAEKNQEQKTKSEIKTEETEVVATKPPKQETTKPKNVSNLSLPVDSDYALEEF